jgi:hypothetical protein
MELVVIITLPNNTIQKMITSAIALLNYKRKRNDNENSTNLKKKTKNTLPI